MSRVKFIMNYRQNFVLKYLNTHGNNPRGHAYSPNWCHLGTVVRVFVVSSPNLLGDVHFGSYERF